MKKELQDRLDLLTSLVRGGAGENDLLEPIDAVEQIALLISLKLLDEEEEDRLRIGAERGGAALVEEGLFPHQTQRYRWSRWRSLEAEDRLAFVRDDVLPYMASLGGMDRQTAAFFRGTTLRIEDPETFRRIVDEVDAITLNQSRTDDGGEALEYVLTNLQDTGSSPIGEFRTPRRLRKLMVKMLDPAAGETIHDPACGTGGFLVDAAEHVRGKTGGAGEDLPEPAGRGRFLHGTELNRTVARIATANLALHGLRGARLDNGDALDDLGEPLFAGRRNEYDVVLSNPPMGNRYRRERVRGDLPVSSARIGMLFPLLLAESLAPGGRCAMVVPDLMLQGRSRTHGELRQWLLRRFQILAVVSLPPSTFRPYSSLRASVVLFRRPALSQRQAAAATRCVWFHELGSDALASSRGCRADQVTADSSGVAPLLTQWEAYRASGFREPVGNEALAVLPRSSEEPRSWWAPFEMIAENGCVLAASRYRPVVPEPLPDEDPAELIRDAIEIERKLVAGLEQVLRAVEA